MWKILNFVLQAILIFFKFSNRLGGKLFFIFGVISGLSLVLASLSLVTLSCIYLFHSEDIELNILTVNFYLVVGLSLLFKISEMVIEAKEEESKSENE